MRRLLALVLGLAIATPAVAFAKKADDEEEASDEEESSSDDEEASSSDDEEEASDEEEATEKPKKKKKKGDDEEAEAEPKEFVKQNLSGHDLGTKKAANMFEEDRFFVDKVDTEKTEKGTLIQGSLASSSFLFAEKGGEYAGAEQGPNSARFSRMFTELRLQTDFRHISGSRWDARVDARIRVVNQPEQATPDPTSLGIATDPNRVQSGFNGTNELDLRELWVFRSGKRSDIFFGRQFLPDLGGVKFDGLRVDYASSQRLTLIGFAGLYPLRGSRSLTTDYTELKDNEGNPAGRFVGAGGFGAAYRTINAYGAFGGVVLYPLAGEPARVFATSTGYLRNGAALDVYHFALVDLFGSQGAGLTNLSIGANYKPSPRLRLTAAVNRVDVDTLAVQANAFLSEPEAMSTNVQNETFFRRLATNTGRVGVSAGLGQFQRFEISVSTTYRARKQIFIPVAGMTTVRLQGTAGVDVYGSIVDRRSFKDMRIGIDALRTIGTGNIAYARSTILAVRGFVARELKNGHGEWEAEVGYSNARDSASGSACIAGTTAVNQCFGSSYGTIISAGGSLYYRINRDWFALGTVFLSRQGLNYTEVQTGATRADPAVYGLTGFGRIAYRF